MAVQEAVGRKVFQQRLRAKDGSALIKEYAEVESLYQQVVTQRLSQARREALWGGYPSGGIQGCSGVL